MKPIILIAALALGACASNNGTTTINTPSVSSVAADVNLVVGGLSAALATPGLPVSPDTLTIAKSALSSLQALAPQIQSAASAADAKPLVQQVETYVNAVIAAANADPTLTACTSSTCATIRSYVAAANVLLPVIEIAVNLAVAQQPSSTAANAARATLAAPASN